MPLGDFGNAGPTYGSTPVNNNYPKDTRTYSPPTYANDNPNVTGHQQVNPTGATLGGQVFQDRQYTPTALDPATQQQIAKFLGLTQAGVQDQTNDYTTLYDINKRKNALSGQGVGLDNQDVNSQIAQQNYDSDYRNKMIASLQGDLGSYTQARGLYGDQLQNQIQGYQQQYKADQFNTSNKYVGGGAQFTPGYGFNLANNFGTLLNKSGAADIQNKLTNNQIDRSVSGTNRDIYGQENQLNQNNEQVKQLNTQLAKNGLKLNSNALDMEQLKAEFDQRIKALGINAGIDVNKFFEGLNEGNKNQALSASEVNVLKALGLVG